MQLGYFWQHIKHLRRLFDSGWGGGEVGAPRPGYDKTPDAAQLKVGAREWGTTSRPPAEPRAGPRGVGREGGRGNLKGEGGRSGSA